MPYLKMSTQHILSLETLNKVFKEVLIGNYAFGFIKVNKQAKKTEFIPMYVGRSDNDLKKEIYQQGLILKVKDGKQIYTHFKFSIAKNIKEAYLKECKNYHDYHDLGLLDNKIHPKRPSKYKISTLPCSKLKCLN